MLQSKINVEINNSMSVHVVVNTMLSTTQAFLYYLEQQSYPTNICEHVMI